jgi:hypothetical protein
MPPLRSILPSDPSAHTVLCVVSAQCDYDWKEATGPFPAPSRVMGTTNYINRLGRQGLPLPPRHRSDRFNEAGTSAHLLGA